MSSDFGFKSYSDTILSVPIHRNTYTICTSKISKFCRSVPHSIIHFEHSGPSPSASMNFSHWFSAFSLSRCLVTLRLLPSSCSLIGQSRRKWCPTHSQHFTGCFIFTCSIYFESSCLDRFSTSRLDDPPSFPFPIAPRRIFTSLCKPMESCKIWWFISFYLFCILSISPIFSWVLEIIWRRLPAKSNNFWSAAMINVHHRVSLFSPVKCTIEILSNQA